MRMSWSIIEESGGKSNFLLASYRMKLEQQRVSKERLTRCFLHKHSDTNAHKTPILHKEHSKHV